MIYADFFLRNQETYLCITQEDVPEVKEQIFAEKRIALEIGAVVVLPCFPAIQKLILLPGECAACGRPLHISCSALELKIDYYSDEIDDYTVDLSGMFNLNYVFSRSLYGFCHADKCAKLKAITIGEWCEAGFRYLGQSEAEEIDILRGRLVNLSGVEEIKNLRFLSISYCPRLQDLSHLSRCSELDSLILENCGSKWLPHVPVLPHLRFLRIRTPSIPSATWFDRFPNLQYLILDTKIEDGKMEPFCKLQHCMLITEHPHYTLRNCDLPKSEIVLPRDACNYALPVR